MESKKSIGNYFKENLDKLDYAPSDKVWIGIETELNEKKKKRRLFIWLFFIAFLCGSLFTYTLTTYNPFQSSNPDAKENTVTDKSTRKNQIENHPSEQSILTNDSLSISKDTEHSVADANNTTKGGTSSFGSDKNKSAVSASMAVKNKKSKSGKNTVTSVKNNSTSALKSTKYAQSKKRGFHSSSEKNEIKKKNASKSPGSSNGTIPEKSTSAIVSSFGNEIAATEQKTETIKTDSLENKTKLDSLVAINEATKEKKKRALEKEKDSTTTKQKDNDLNIVVAPYIGFSHYGNFGKGNPISDKYTITDESTAILENFGVLVRWMGSEKLGIQTGFGILHTKRFSTVAKQNDVFIQQSNVELDYPAATINNLFANDDSVRFTEENRYFEIPLEAYYVVSDKKFGWATSFGVSLIVNQKNEVFLESDSVEKFKIGSSKNIMSSGFSGNIKLNLFYKISKRLQWDLYPEFQYRIMEYKDVSNYNPYLFSIKTGLSYKL